MPMSDGCKENVRFRLLLEYATGWGWANFYVDRAQYVKYRGNPLGLVALHFGVTVDEYLSWVEARGAVQCIAKTSKGRQCRCYVFGKTNLGLNEWIDAIKVGGYCSRHGGEQ